MVLIIEDIDDGFFARVVKIEIEMGILAICFRCAFEKTQGWKDYSNEGNASDYQRFQF